MTMSEDISFGRVDFEAWLTRHHAHLLNYDPFEVARLALACGFNMRDIGPDVSSWITQSQRKLKLYENPLFDQWVSLWVYERGHDWDM